MVDLFSLTDEAVRGLGLELVDVERAPLGVLRVTIDKPTGVTIDDCEEVSGLLKRVYEVEEVDYKRLEVSSPGVDRPLKTEADFIRFSGERIEVKFRQAVNNQKVFVGVLGMSHVEPAVSDLAEADVSSEVKSSPVFNLTVPVKKNEVQTLSFTFDQVDKAKLDPVLDFKKGKKK